MRKPGGVFGLWSGESWSAGMSERDTSLRSQATPQSMNTPPDASGLRSDTRPATSLRHEHNLNLPWAILLPVIGGAGALAFDAAGWNRSLIRLWSGVAIALSFASLILLSDPAADVAWTRVILAAACAAGGISTVASASHPESHKSLSMILLSLAALAITCQTESLATLVAASCGILLLGIGRGAHRVSSGIRSFFHDTERTR